MQLTPEQLDTLSEIMNIAVGKAAASLAGILQRRIQMHLVEVRMVSKDQIQAIMTSEIGDIGSAVEQRFKGGLTGTSLMMISNRHTATLINLLQESGHETGEDYSTGERAIMTEVGNVVLNAAVGMCSNQTGARVYFQLPKLLLNVQGPILADDIIAEWQENVQGIMLKNRLSIGDYDLIVHILIILAMPTELIQYILDTLLNP
jgi:chemotaxis protein CheC